MDRLTYWNNKEKGSALPTTINDNGDTVDLETLCVKLAAYEDTGLEPSEIPTGLEMANIFAAMQKLKLRRGAEKQGKLHIAPGADDRGVRNSTRLIDGNALYQQFLGRDGVRYREKDCDGFLITVNLADIKKTIRNAPTVEAVPLVHGRWKKEINFYFCSECEFAAHENLISGVNYCPSCGAIMDLEG